MKPESDIYVQAGTAGKTLTFWSMTDWPVDKIEHYLRASTKLQRNPGIDWWIDLANRMDQPKLVNKLTQIKLKWLLQPGETNEN